MAANPASDISSPLDLGNCLLSCSGSFLTQYDLPSSNHLCAFTLSFKQESVFYAAPLTVYIQTIVDIVFLHISVLLHVKCVQEIHDYALNSCV